MRLHTTTEKLLVLYPLHPDSAAELLVWRAPQPLVGVSSLKEVMQHPVVRELHGHPAAIVACAAYLRAKTLDQLSPKQAAAIYKNNGGRKTDRPTFQQALMDASQGLAAHGLEDRRCAEMWAQLLETARSLQHPEVVDVAAADLASLLCRKLNSCGQRTPDAEALTEQPRREVAESDLLFMRARIHAAAPKGAAATDRVTLPHFVSLCRWWAPVRDTIARLADDWRCTHPTPRILGLLDRRTAKDLLSVKRVGSFLLRFSESDAGKLALSYVCAKDAPSGRQSGNALKQAPAQVEAGKAGKTGEVTVQHTLVQVQEDGVTISFQGGTTGRYPTLSSMVLDCKLLKFVAPASVPASKVFTATA